MAGWLLLVGWAIYPWSALLPNLPLPEGALAADIFLAAAGLAAAARLCAARGRSCEPERQRAAALLKNSGWAACAYLGWMLLAWWVNGASQRGAYKLLFTAELLLLALAAALQSRDSAWRRRLWRVTLANSMLAPAAALLGIALFLAGAPGPLVGTYGDLPPAPWYARAQAGFAHPNMMAAWAVAAAAIVAGGGGGLRHQIPLALLTLLAASRSAVSFAAAYLLRRGVRTIAVLAAASALLVALTWAPAAPAARRQAAQSSWQTFAASPWFGTGPGAHPGRARGVPFEAHLAPLNVAAQAGLPAACAIGLFFFLLLKRSPANSTWNKAIRSGIIAILLEGLANDIEDYRHLWLLAGLAPGAAGSPEEPGSADEEEGDVTQTPPSSADASRFQPD